MRLVPTASGGPVCSFSSPLGDCVSLHAVHFSRRITEGWPCNSVHPPPLVLCASCAQRCRRRRPPLCFWDRHGGPTGMALHSARRRRQCAGRRGRSGGSSPGCGSGGGGGDGGGDPPGTLKYVGGHGRRHRPVRARRVGTDGHVRGGAAPAKANPCGHRRPRRGGQARRPPPSPSRVTTVAAEGDATACRDRHPVGSLPSHKMPFQYAAPPLGAVAGRNLVCQHWPPSGVTVAKGGSADTMCTTAPP